MTAIITTPKPVWAMKARTGAMRRYRKLVFFACEGLIALHDERDGSYVVILPDEFEFRARALQRKSRLAKDAEKPWHRQERREQRQASQDMLEAVEEAKYMGDPSSPEVHAFWQRHHGQTGLPYGGSSDPRGYPKMPRLPVGAFTGKTADIESLPTIHTPPRRKPRPGKLILPAEAL